MRSQCFRLMRRGIFIISTLEIMCINLKSWHQKDFSEKRENEEDEKRKELRFSWNRISLIISINAHEHAQTQIRKDS